jgi:uncharacterized protein (TIGR01777 family)
MKILVSGSTGLVGSALVPFLRSNGAEVRRLVRARPRRDDEIGWDAESGLLDPAKLQGFDAVVHLAGESIAGGRWSEAKKERIRKSRVLGTRRLSEAIASVERKPRVLVCASAVGFYGDAGERILDEASPPGEGFLPEVCRAWEAAADPARAAKIRVVHLRFGMILSGAGGALRTMLLPFELGLGGRVGSGAQWMPWVALDDAIESVRFAIAMEALAGAANVVAPEPATNARFTKTLGRVLGRPTILPLPAFAVRILFGEMGEALLLASTRAVPEVLPARGFRFQHPEIEGALRHVLGR